MRVDLRGLERVAAESGLHATDVDVALEGIVTNMCLNMRKKSRARKRRSERRDHSRRLWPTAPRVELRTD